MKDNMNTPGTAQTLAAGSITIELLCGEFSICKLSDFSQANLSGEFCFTGRTDSECSLVCPTGEVPANAFVRDDGWRAFRIRGTLDFSLVGILAGIAGILAAESIGIFAISTFDTDYMLTRRENLGPAFAALAAAGYVIAEQDS